MILSEIKEIYDAAFSHSHDAALQAVWNAAVAFTKAAIAVEAPEYSAALPVAQMLIEQVAAAVAPAPAAEIAPAPVATPAVEAAPAPVVEAAPAPVAAPAVEVEVPVAGL